MGTISSINNPCKYIKCSYKKRKSNTKNQKENSAFPKNFPSNAFANQENSFSFKKKEMIDKKEKCKNSLNRKVLNFIENENAIKREIFDFSKKNHPKFIESIRHGSLEKLRWIFWKNLYKDDEVRFQAIYENLKTMMISEETYNNIAKDLERTFPGDSFFKTSENKLKLYNLLKAISLYYSNIGYCQGMNVFAGFFLIMSNGNEVESFKFFIEMSNDPSFFLVHLFEENLSFLKFLIFLFERKISQHLPSLYLFLKKIDLPYDAWLVKWFLSIFLNGFGFSQSMRFWDYILSTDIYSLITLAVAILKTNYHKFEKQKDNWEKIDFYNFYENIQKNLDVEKCLKEADKMKIGTKDRNCKLTEFLKDKENERKSSCLNYFFQLKVKEGKRF